MQDNPIAVGQVIQRSAMGYFSPIIREHLKDVQHLAHGRLLDIGCGNKPYQNIFTNVTTYIGCDYLTLSVEKEKVNLSRATAVDVIADAGNLPFADQSFDTVLSTQLIEHLAEPWLFFFEVARVLTESGYLLLTFPLINPVHEAPYDFFRYTEFGVRELCRRSGLVVKDVVPMGGGWLTVGYLMRHFLYRASAERTSLFGRRTLFFVGSCIYGVMERLDTFNNQPDSPLNYLMIVRKDEVAPTQIAFHM